MDSQEIATPPEGVAGTPPPRDEIDEEAILFNASFGAFYPNSSEEIPWDLEVGEGVLGEGYASYQVILIT